MDRSSDDWRKIRERKEEVGHRCEWCDRPCRKIGQTIQDFMDCLSGTKWEPELVVTVNRPDGTKGKAFNLSAFTMTAIEAGSGEQRWFQVICGACWLEYRRKEGNQ